MTIEQVTADMPSTIEHRTFAGGSIETTLEHICSDGLRRLHFIDYGAPNPTRVSVRINELGHEMVGELLGGIDRKLDAYIRHVWAYYAYYADKSE